MKKYKPVDCFNTVPRVMISMSIFNDCTEVGYNNHYSLDTPLPEALSDFFQSMKDEFPKHKINLEKSKLEIKYLDLPTGIYNKPLT